MMTTQALERAARAVCELHGGDYWDKAAPYERGRYRDVARAVLMAVLPTLERWDANHYDGVSASPGGDYVRYADFQAILNDGEVK